jgi:penicillin-binding protein 1C
MLMSVIRDRLKYIRIPKHILRYFFFVLPLSMIVLIYLVILKDLPSVQKLEYTEIPQSSKIYDKNGKLLFDVFEDQNRSYVPLSDIPLTLRHATIAIEDKNFYQHRGINPIGGILRALTATVTKGSLQGGSTITQQLVKSALLTPERTITRKIREIILAYLVEKRYNKDKILELYLNQVPYGGTAWGVATASEKFFGKSVKDLTLSESALLAGLPQAPTLYSPFGSRPDLAIERQSEVLKRMLDDGYITQDDVEQAKNQPITFAKPRNIKAPHFVMFVKELLAEKYGEETLSGGGLKITTTLDLDLQEYVEASLSAEITKLSSMHVTNGAALVTNPATGEILSMVGSADYFATASGSFNVTTALRQPGSSIKPVNYAIGIENNVITPATMFLDVPTCFGVPNLPTYCPKNYDGKFHGPTQTRLALGNSYNIPAVKMMYLNSLETFVASSSAWGLDTLKDPSQYGLSLTLGGGEVRMTDMAEAFGVLANGGVRKDLVAIRKIIDKNGSILANYEDPNLDKPIPSQILLKGPRVISSETAFLISHILLDNNARQDMFGTSSLLVIPNKAVSVKTGTTDDLRDNWTIGYTPLVLVAVWVGNNDNSPMNRNLVSGVTGAAPIWNKIMKRVLLGKPDIWPKQPTGVVGAQICTTSGLLPPNPDGEDKGCITRYEYFKEGTVPKEKEQMKQTVAIDPATGDLAPPGKTDGVEMKEHLILKDPLSTWCVDCTHPEKASIFIPVKK